MDPDATLAQIRSAVRDSASESPAVRDLACTALVDLVQGLDQWLTNGGFLPHDWIR